MLTIFKRIRNWWRTRTYKVAPGIYIVGSDALITQLPDGWLRIESRNRPEPVEDLPEWLTKEW